MSFIIQNVALAIYGVNAKDVPPLIPDSDVFDIGGVNYQWNKLFVFLVTVPVLLGLTWLVSTTRQGKAMRATAQDPEAAAMMGINVNRTISFTFLIAGALAGVGAPAVPAALQHALRHGLRARPDRVHRRRARRDRQPHRAPCSAASSSA